MVDNNLIKTIISIKSLKPVAALMVILLIIYMPIYGPRVFTGSPQPISIYAFLIIFLVNMSVLIFVLLLDHYSTKRREIQSVKRVQSGDEELVLTKKYWIDKKAEAVRLKNQTTNDAVRQDNQKREDEYEIGIRLIDERIDYLNRSRNGTKNH
jgi:hypothetical protein